MTADFRLKFNFASWKKANRGDLIFWGIIIVASFAILLFLTEGFILYQEFFGKKKEIPLTVIIQPLAGKELDETLKTIDEREKEFNEVLQKP